MRRLFAPRPTPAPRYRRLPDLPSRRTRYLNCPAQANTGWHSSGFYGAYVKTITESGGILTITTQLDDNTENVIMFQGGGGASSYKGQYDDTVDYDMGDVVSVGSGTGVVFYRAPTNILAGGGEPTIQERGEWIITAHRGQELGALNSALTYDIRIGDIWTLGSEAYLASQHLLDATGAKLSSGAGVIHLSAPAPALWAQATNPMGTAPVERLGTGTPSDMVFLRGDGAWAIPAGATGSDGTVSRTSIGTRTLTTAATGNQVLEVTEALSATGLYELEFEAGGEFVSFIFHGEYVTTLTPTTAASRQGRGVLGYGRIDSDTGGTVVWVAPDNADLMGLSMYSGQWTRLAPAGATVTLYRLSVQGAQGPAGPAGPAGTSVTANPATVTDVLTSIGIGAINYAISGIVTPGTNGQLRAATAEDENRVAIDHSNLRVWHREVDTQTPPAVGFTNYAPPNFSGSPAYCPSLPGPHAMGDICFSTGNRLWYRWGGSSWSTLNANPPNWRGARNDRDDAIAHITGVGQIVWWTGQARPQQVTSFVRGHDDLPLHVGSAAGHQGAPGRRVSRAYGAGNAGQVCQVNAAGDAYETTAISTGTFTGLTDTPAAISANQCLQGNSAGDALTFAACAAGGDSDGVVTGGMVTQGTLTLVRSQGADVTIGGFADVVVVADANVTQVSGGVNHIEFLNTANPIDGTVYHWVSETTTTGSVQIRIGVSDYTVFKAGETVGSFTPFSGGEFENTIPQQVTFEDGALYWTGTLLGTAASEDVGTDAGELVRLNAGGKFNPEQLGTNPPNDQNWLRGDGQWAGFPVLVDANPGGTGNADLRSIRISGTNYDIIDVEANPGGQGNAEITSITINDVDYDVSIGDAQPAALRHEINRIAALERITSQLSITRENEGTPTTVTGPIIARATTLPTVVEARALTYANEITHADSDTHRFYIVRLAFDDDPDDYTMVLTEGDGGTQNFPVRTFSEIPQLSEFAYYAIELHFPFRVTGTVTVQQQTIDSYDTRYGGEVNEELARQLAEAFNYRGDHTLEVRQTFTPGHYLGNDNPAQTIFRHGTEVYLAYFDGLRIQVNRETIREGDFSDVTTMMRNDSHWIYPQGNQMHFVRIDDTTDVTSITYPQGALVANGTYEVRKIIPAGTDRMLVLFYAGGSTPPFVDLRLYDYTTTQITTVAGTPTMNAGVINALVGATYEDFTDNQIQSVDWDLDANIAWFMVNDAMHSGTALPGTLVPRRQHGDLHGRRSGAGAPVRLLRGLLEPRHGLLRAHRGRRPEPHSNPLRHRHLDALRGRGLAGDFRHEHQLRGPLWRTRSSSRTARRQPNGASSGPASTSRFPGRTSSARRTTAVRSRASFRAWSATTP